MTAFFLSGDYFDLLCYTLSMDRRLIKAAAVIIIVLLIAAVYFIKNSDSIMPMQSAIDENAGVLQSGRESLKIQNFEPSMITESEVPMIIVIGEDYCQPCLRMMPDLEELHRSHDDISIRYIDLGENENAAAYFPIRVTPTIVVFEKNGEPFTPGGDSPLSYILYSDKNTGEHVMTVHEGYLTRSELEGLIEEVLGD